MTRQEERFQLDIGLEVRRGWHYGYVVLLFGMLNLAGSLGLGRFAYTMILPAMRDGLGFHNTQMGLIGTIGFIGYLAMTIPGGMLAARFGPRLVITLALLVCGLGMLLMGSVSSLNGSIVLMIIVGIGSAAGNAAGFSFASAWFAGRSRGKATGIIFGGAGFGMVTVGLLIPFILAHGGAAGWRWAWYVSGTLTVLFGILCGFFLRNSPADMGLRPIGEEDRESEAGIPQPGASTAIPLAWRRVYTSRELWRVSFIILTFGFAYIIYGTFFAAYVQDEVGLSKAEAGALWSLVGFLAIFSGLIGGTLSDRLGGSWAFTCLLLAQILALLLVALSQRHAFLYASIALFGLSVWGFPALLGVTCADVLGPRLAPAGVGFAIFFFAIGQAAGPITAGALHDRTGSFAMPFLTGAAALLLGLIATWARFGGSLHGPGSLDGTAQGS